MKVICTKSQLLTGIQTVQRAVATKTTLPVLSGIFIQTEKNKIRFLASDMEVSIETYIEADVKEQGETVVPARYFGEIIRSLPMEDVELDADLQNNKIHIKCGKAEFFLNGMDPDEFPPFSRIGNELSFTIDQLLFKEMIRQTIFAVSVSEARPVFTGILLHLENDEITLVATDTHRLAVRNGKIKYGEEMQASVIVPGKTMGEVFRLLKNEGELEIRISSQQIAFQIGETCLISRLLEGQFPNYKTVIPKEFRTKINVLNDDILGAVERASLLARESGNIIKFDVRKDRIVFESHTPEIGSTYEEVFVHNDGEELKISFNSKYIIDVLKVIGRDEVELSLSDSLSPGVFRPSGEEHFLYLVLPIRTRN